MQPSDYHAIALWGRQLSSYRPYIEEQQEEAAAENAPEDAIFKREDGTWAQVSTLKEGHPFRRDYQTYLAEIQSGRLKPYYKASASPR